MPSSFHIAPIGSAILKANDFETAVGAVLPALTRYARRLAGNGADAEDLVQDTLLKGWAARTSFTPGTNFKAWLMRIERNTFLSWRHRAGRQVLWDAEDVSRALVTGIEQETAVMLDDLTTAVAALPTPQRRAFEMVVVEGLSYEDAAVRLDVELGTLKSQVSRARAALVRTLDTIPPPLPVEPLPAGPLRETDPPVRRNVYAAWKASGARLIGERSERLAA